MIKTGIYRRDFEGTIYEWTILKVMPKTLSVELRTCDSETLEPNGDSWFSYRVPKDDLSFLTTDGRINK